MTIRIEIDDNDVARILGEIGFGRNTEKKEPTNSTAIVPESEDKIEEKETEVGSRTYSFTELRTLLTNYSRDGFTDQVRELVGKYGNGKLSGVDPERYSELADEARIRCKQSFTKEDIVARIEELMTEGHADELPGLFEHHYATSIDDLNSNYYSSFMRDAWSIDHVQK